MTNINLGDAVMRSVRFRDEGDRDHYFIPAPVLVDEGRAARSVLRHQTEEQ